MNVGNTQLLNMYAPKTRTFHWSFDGPIERVWAALADTERFNEAARLPKYDVLEAPLSDGSVQFFGRAKVGVADIIWQECPTDWVKYSWFRHEREFVNGPLTVLSSTLKLRPADKGCQGEYVLTARPRNII